MMRIKGDFIRYYKNIRKMTVLQVHAWCLMFNHDHFLLKEGERKCLYDDPERYELDDTLQMYFIC